jgi:thiamine biosynthesis lipoprotein
MLPHNHQFDALGTIWNIATQSPLPDKLLKQIHAEVECFDHTYSRFRADSLVTQIAKRAGDYTFPSNAKYLFDFYKDLYDRTSGKVTPLIGAMLERAGYDADYSFEAKTQRALPNWEDALRWQGARLNTTQPVVLDVGAAGKGYLVDIVSHTLDEELIGEYVVDASGDLRHKGTIQNSVGLEHPLDPSKVIGVVNIQNESIAASAINRRRWSSDLHHIFDPDTQAPVEDIVATWVITKEAIVADGLATALFFVDPAALNDAYEFQYVRAYADGHIDYSYDFKGELF